MTSFIEITDFNAPELDVYARLSEPQLFHINEPEPGIFIAESPKVIGRALDGGCRPLSFLVERGQAGGGAEAVLKRCSGVPVYTAQMELLTKITGYKLTRGMLCAMLRPPLPAAEEICRGARRIAVLERVMNPTNVGAIFRSAAAMGMDGILLTPGSSDPLYRRAARVSMGTVFQIPWTFLGAGRDEAAAWPKGGMARLRRMGFRTAAMALREDSISISDPRLKAEERLALILGTEGDGLAAETMADCDYIVRIPMAHGVDSLNVAAASAVAFWEVGRESMEANS